MTKTKTKTLISQQRGEVSWLEIDVKEKLDRGEFRFTSEFGAEKHGTMMAFFKGYGQDRGPYDEEYQLHRKPDGEAEHGTVYLGNMLYGTVTEVGPETRDYEVGDKVVAYKSFTPVGVGHVDWAYKFNPEVPWKSAVCIDPALFALGAIRDAHVRVGDAVAIFGLGAIGLMAVQLAKLAGAYPIIAIDPLESRRQVAAQTGADLTIDPVKQDAGLEIKEATAKRGADAVIEFSGAAPAMQAGLRGLAWGGRLAMGAYPPPYPAGLDFGAEAHINSGQIIFSRACSNPNREHPRWSEARLYEVCHRLINTGQLDGDLIVNPVVPFEDLPNQYGKIASEPQNVLKLGVQF